MQAFTINPIGVINNSVHEPVDMGWGTVESSLVFDPGLEKALDGLEDFSHLLVIFWMHQAPPPAVVRRRPQGREDMPEVGILAQRARHRPNPIGVTAVEALGRQGNIIRVRGLDAIDGTPILDIKPYYPQYDARTAYVPAWVDQLMAEYF